MAGRTLGLRVILALSFGSAWCITLPCSTWMSMASRRAKVQTRQSSVMDFSTCMDNCYTDSTCKGFDWTTLAGIDDDRRCNFAMTSDKFTKIYSTSTYWLKLSSSCPSNVVDTEVFETCLVSRFVGYTGVVDKAWATFASSDVAACKAKCKLNSATCIGFAMVSTTCYIWQGTKHLLLASAGSFYYVLESCGTSPSLSTLSDISQNCLQLESDAENARDYKSGTVKSAGRASIVDCLATCQADSNCAAATFDSKVYNHQDGSPCKTFTGTVAENTNGSPSRFSRYKVTSRTCPSSTTVTDAGNGYHWYEYANTRGGVGTAYTTVTSASDLAACMTLCVADRDCWAIDWTTSGTTCSLYEKNVAYVLVTLSGTTHRVKKMV